MAALTLSADQVSSDHVLRSVLHENDHVQESLLMKVNDERPGVAVEHIETVPDFLRVRVALLRERPGEKGAIPAGGRDSPCPLANFAEPHLATIRSGTDHPRLPMIEIKVDFTVISGGDHAGPFVGQ